MFTALVLSSVLSGLAATAVMLVVLYLPLLWSGVYYDTVGALGSMVTKKVDARARVLGTMLLFAGGILFAVMYGGFALLFETGPFDTPNYQVFPGAPTEINLFYPLIGLVGGLGHGLFTALITTFVVTDFHPLEEYKDPLPLVMSYMIGHLAFGVTVMFFQHQLLQLLLL